MELRGARTDSLDAAPVVADDSPAVGQEAERDRFTASLFERLLRIACHDAWRLGVSIEEAIGLSTNDVDAIASLWAPWMTAAIAEMPRQAEVEFDEEERQLLALFRRFGHKDGVESRWLASILTRRSMSPNHLWQDLGLNSRAELGRLMREFFPALAERNSQNMKWKKFFYRCLCEMEGFTLCAAPSCQQCSDHGLCFGEESGAPRLPSRGVSVSDR